MVSLPFVLLIAAAAVFACVGFNRLSGRLGIPALLAFLLLGMAFGSDGFLQISFDNYVLAEQVCSFALIFIMFYGGFGTNWRAARPVAVPAVLLSSAGVVLTALLVGLFCHLVLGFSLLEGLLVGAVLGSTDAASVFSILRARKLALKENTASLLELESGSNDPFAYMLTAVLLTAMESGITPGAVVRLLVTQVGLGLAFGFGIGLLSIRLLRRLRFDTPGFDAVFVVAVALLAYAAPSVLEGNGYLSVYIAGILLGNSAIRNKKQLVPFFDGVTGIMQMLLFFLLGLLCFPSQMPRLLPQAAAIAVFLTVVARPLAVFALLTPFGSSRGQRLLVAWSGLRGAASIVFAVMAVISPTEVGTGIFHIVFLVVLLSIGLQGSLLPAVARRLGMIDTGEGADVGKTFTDYTDEVPVQFIGFSVPEGHPWAGRAVRELTLPPGTILVTLRRGSQELVPTGSTRLASGDRLVLCAMAPQGENIQFVEKTIGAEDLQQGSRICDLPRRQGSLIVLVQRRGKVLIPNGDTRLEPGDLLVLHSQN